MCAVCVNNKLDCAKALDFKYMKVISQYSKAGSEDVFKVVKCLMFNRTVSGKGGMIC